MLYEEHGYIGNIWVKQNYLEKCGDKVSGHVHYFDHVSLLAKGSVEVSLDGKEPHVFRAPTFIIIRKNHRHEITALEDDTSWYCIFAARDIDGQILDIAHPENEPWFAGAAPDDYWDNRNITDNLTIRDIQ